MDEEVYELDRLGQLGEADLDLLIDLTKWVFDLVDADYLSFLCLLYKYVDQFYDLIAYGT